MTVAPVEYNVWYIIGVFIANGIGCVLAVFALVRMTDERRSTGNRAFLVVAAAWGLIETARDDALFVLATAVHLRDDGVRFFLAPGLGLTVLSMLIAIAVLGIAAARPRPLWTIIAGVTVGLLTAAMVVQSVLSARTGYAVSIDVPAAVAIAAGLAVVTSASVFLATGATARRRMSVPIMVLAVCMTAAQYLLAGEILTDLSSVVDSEIGVGAIEVIFISAATFFVRTLGLTVVSMTDEGRVDQPASPDLF
ncbi:hypothetical protein ACQP00_22335 [Dactylosporangium sp. CS-047395]|uniref:hypothetical protein n=1 Tax=Dactylosporangium sp. CS-047395 TaxID=3239936 RepID=UPI003D932D06